MTSTITYAPHATVFAGRAAVNVYRYAALASALRMWAKYKMQANRAYTPKVMMQLASQFTGQKFRSRDYIAAADALTVLVEITKAGCDKVVET